MRGKFVLVVIAGIAAAVGVSTVRGRLSTGDGTGAAGERETSSDPGEVAPSSVAPVRADAEAAGETTPDTGDPVLEAKRILAGEASALSSAEARRRALRCADLLVARADAAPSKGGMDLRLLARSLVAAVHDRDEAAPAERSAALERSRALFDVLVRGNGAPAELVLRHKVAAGENVWALARGTWKSAGATVAPGFVLWLNGVADARRIRAGQTLKVPLEPLTVLVRKSTFELTVHLGGAPIERFQVAVGPDARTPVGTFRAGDCLKNPDWYVDGRRIPFGSPGHIIGTRWIAFTGAPEAEGIGIHGTDDASSIGRAVSLGCVRMRNADVERLFDWVGPGTSIEVRD